MSVNKSFLVVVYSGTGRTQISGKATEAEAVKHALALAAQNPDQEVYVYRAQCFAQARLTPATVYPVLDEERQVEEETS